MPIFEQIIEGGYQYIDKTELIYKLTHTYNYVFLSRPRRFGKSLLVSTLKSYFEGRADLFKGLAMDRLETEWKQYPVVHMSLGSVKESSLATINSQINDCLDEVERSLQLQTTPRDTIGSRLKEIIIRSHEKYGMPAVVLIDEYDAPLLNNITNEILDDVRNTMRAFYAPLKECLEHIRFIFITGITKFSQLSIFSELNNLSNISMLPQYSTICGITEHELTTFFGQGISNLATHNQTARDEMIATLRQYYNGYHFAREGSAVYNPYSIVCAMQNEYLDYYWYNTGTPTILLKLLQKYRPDITKLDGCVVKSNQFDVPTEKMTNVLPLFYQSGYLTIKEYDQRRDRYTLGFPNDEVRFGIMDSLIPNYVTAATDVNPLISAEDIRFAFEDNDVSAAITHLRHLLKSIPYQEGTRRNEGHYTSMLYVIFMLVGIKVQSQVRTADGRLDILLTTSKRNYLIELKLNRSAREALAQIDSKDYALAVTNKLPVTKIGINFSTDTGTIADWMLREE